VSTALTIRLRQCSGHAVDDLQSSLINVPDPHVPASLLKLWYRELSEILMLVCKSCKLFGLTSGDFLNNKVLVGDERLFTVTVTEKERMYVELARELIKEAHMALRPVGHEFVLPSCKYDLHKRSFIVRSLFNFLTD